MLPQKKILTAIIKYNRLDLLDYELPNYFYDDLNKNLLKIVYEIKYLDRLSPTYDTVKTKINRSEFRDYIKQNLIIRLDEICEDRSLISEKPKDALRDDFRSFYINKMLNFLSDKSKTDEIKEECIHKISKLLSKTTALAESMLSSTIDAHMKAVESGESIKFHENCIKLTDYNLAFLFFGKIYPRPYCFFARPRDMKTSTLINLHVEFLKLGKFGMHITLEDTIDGYMLKHIACAMNFSKERLINNLVDTDELRNAKSHLKSDMLIYNRRGTVTELRHAIDSAMDRYKIKWISIDYLQRIKRDKESDLEMLSSATSMLMDVSNEYVVPVFYMSQVNDRDDKVVKILKPGDTKGSGTIEADARFMASINRLTLENTNKRLFHACKTTDSGEYDREITYNMESGKIISVDEICDEKKTQKEPRYEEYIRPYKND